MYGRALLEMESKNGALLFPIAYTAIHIQVDEQWQLLAMQATRVALDGLASVRRRSVGRRSSTGGSAVCERRSPCQYRRVLLPASQTFAALGWENGVSQHHRILTAHVWTNSSAF
ncbi:MAG: Zn-dependent hydrolases, including glyoxylases [uncultured Caballeronia sp.]|nr:MAG: Zn-dependent hydrolases, including glyoxylases [uncultured Caballeronia sp.]